MTEGPTECPLCMEALDVDDYSFFPCTCGYQICRFCWHRIRTDENGLCPACRKQYPEDPAEFKPLTDDELQNIKKERKQKDAQRKHKAAENRKHLANVRVVQKNLVFVVGLSPRLADPEVLKKHEYFGKFGKLHKVVINQSTSYAGSQGPSASAYVTYVKSEDALKAILTVNNVHVDGRILKTSLGTTKYCSHFLKGSHCQKADCMYLHELGEEAASFTKEEMQAGKHQEYEQMLIEQFLNSQNSATNHPVTTNKIKKPVSPQAVESSEMIPSLMDMTGDIKHTQHSLGPLLPNPVYGGAGAQSHLNNSNSSWPLLDGLSSVPGNGLKAEKGPADSNKSQGQSSKSQLRTDMPPVSSNSRVVGARSQRSGSSTSNTDESLILNTVNPVSSSRTSSTTPPGDREQSAGSPQMDQPSHRSLPLPTPGFSAGLQLPLIQGQGISVSAYTPPTTSVNGAHAQSHSEADETSTDSIGAIGSNRRPGLSEAYNAQGLSFFSNNLFPSSAGASQALTNTSFQELPNISLANQEMPDALPVFPNTEWSSVLDLRNSDDDLGFDPCAESFKGLADLMEKENGMQQQQHYLHLAQQQQQHKLGLSAPADLLTHHAPLSPLQNNSEFLRSLPVPPGFSFSHLQQQQQQHLHQQQQFFRQELNGSKMLDHLPQLTPAAHQRFPPSSGYHSLSPDLHVQQSLQREFCSMKDMQEQLRSMLPNINISFGSVPHQQQVQQQQQLAQQQQQQAQQQQQQQQQAAASLQQTHQNNLVSKNWQLSTSPDSSVWNDPAIVTTSQFTESAGIFQDTASHLLKSLQNQMTETEAPFHRLPFVQRFPLASVGGWPSHHTYNPPPGFRASLSSQQTSEAHKMAEVLQ